MTDPQPPRPVGVADLDPHNLQSLMVDMGYGPGWYTSAGLYAWYANLVRSESLEPPSQKAFGMALKELGYRSAIRRVDGKHARCWFITQRALRGEGPR